jgi:hypothetical protein
MELVTLSDNRCIPPATSAFWKSPALTHRSYRYPARFEDRVPMFVKPRFNVRPDFPGIIGAPADSMARKDQSYPAWTNSLGAVAAVLESGWLLGLKPDEFEVTGWAFGTAGWLVFPPPAPYDLALLRHQLAREWLACNGITIHPRIYGCIFPPEHPWSPVTDKITPAGLLDDPQWQLRTFLFCHDEKTAAWLEAIEVPEGAQLQDLAGDAFGARNLPRNRPHG